MYLKAEEWGAGRRYYIFADAVCFSCAVHQAFGEGKNPYDFALQQEGAEANGVTSTPFFYPPSALVPLAVLAPFPVATSGMIMLLLNLAGMVLAYLVFTAAPLHQLRQRMTAHCFQRLPRRWNALALLPLQLLAVPHDLYDILGSGTAWLPSLAVLGGWGLLAGLLFRADFTVRAEPAARV